MVGINPVRNFGEGYDVVTIINMSILNVRQV